MIPALNNRVKNNREPKISFGIIVLNGEPFIKYSLRALYDFAHEIILVEGATKNAKLISTPDGHSTDSTLQSVNDFIRDEDKEKKVKLITRDGFWEEKTKMSQAFASIATGNYIWELGIDEFYLEEDIKKVISILRKDSSITAMSFKMKSFWGGIDYVDESPIFGEMDRLFKFETGYKYINHRPPTIVDCNGKNLRDIKFMNSNVMSGCYDIYMYHYYLIFPLQAKAKTDYYSKTFNKNYYKWLNDNYINLQDPFHVNNNFWKISWLRKYNGQHPKQIVKMMEDIKTGHLKIELRDNHDIDKLLASPKYRILTCLLRNYFTFLSYAKRYVKGMIIYIRIIKRT